MWFLVHSDFFGMQYQNHFDSAGQRNRSRWERELQFFFWFLLLVLIIVIFRLKFLNYVSGFQSVHTNHFIAACSVQISGA